MQKMTKQKINYMKGKLVKKENKWYVVSVEEGDWDTYYPLYRDDVKDLEELERVFDNIEARINYDPKVDFEIVIDTALFVAGEHGACAKLLPQQEEDPNDEELEESLICRNNRDISSQTEISDAGKDTADYIDRHIIESMKELAREGFKPQVSEISDEEIEKAAEKITNIGNRREYWKQGIKWYREQLKQQQ